MAELSPLWDHSSTDDDDLGTQTADAWKTLSYALGHIDDGNSRPNVARVLYADTNDAGGVNAALSAISTRDAAEGARDATDPVVVQLGPGTFEASLFKFDGFNDVIIRGMGRATVIQATPSAQGSVGDFWPNSVNFSNCVRCGIENLRVVLTDDTSGEPVGAIARASNTGLTECWLSRVDIEVGEMDAASRTGNTDFLWAIDYLPGVDKPDARFALIVRECNIISSCGGVRPGEGQWHFHDCNIWYGASANADTPHLIGVDHTRGGRWYFWGGKITTGYDTTDPSTPANVYGIRCNQSTSGGRAFVHNAVIFARNDAASPGTTRAVYMNGATSDPWIRMVSCYLQAELNVAHGFKDNEAVDTDWDPATDGNGGNRLELYGCRVAGIRGNVLGPDGGKVLSADQSMSSHWLMGDTLIDTTAGDVTVTMHTNDPVSNESGYIKNYKGTNNAIIAVGAGDYLNQTVDGTLTVPPGRAVRVKCYDRDGSDKLYFETSRFAFDEWELIDTTAITAVAEIEITSGFAAGYDTRIVINKAQPQTGGSHLRMRTSNDGGSTYDSGASDYAYAIGGPSTQGDNLQSVWSTGAADLPINLGSGTSLYIYHSSGHHMSVDMVFPDPTDTAKRSIVRGTYLASLSGSHIGGQSFVGRRNAAEALDAIKLYWDTGNSFVAQGEISVLRRRIY